MIDALFVRFSRQYWWHSSIFIGKLSRNFQLSDIDLSMGDTKPSLINDERKFSYSMKLLFITKMQFNDSKSDATLEPGRAVKPATGDTSALHSMMNAAYYLAQFNVTASWEGSREEEEEILSYYVMRFALETKCLWRKSSLFLHCQSHFTSTLCIRNEKFNFAALCRVRMLWE